MTDFEKQLRALIATAIRDEVKRAVREATLPVQFLSTEEAADVADVATGTIRRWVKTGKLTGHKAGRVLRIDRRELEQMLREGGKASNDQLTPEQLAAKAFG